MPEPTKEELQAITEEVLAAPLSDHAYANIEITAKAIVDGDSKADEKKNLSLAKMLILTTHRVRELKARL